MATGEACNVCEVGVRIVLISSLGTACSSERGMACNAGEVEGDDREIDFWEAVSFSLSVKSPSASARDR